MEFRRYGDTLVCDTPGREKLSQKLVQRIATHTANTWQSDRPARETLANTIQGKLAELAVETYLKERTRVRYASYDEFREDAFKKHAPFDGLLYTAEVNERQLDGVIDRVNREVAVSETGQIGPELRRWMADHGVFTFEIKSSQLRSRDFEGVADSAGIRSDRDRETIAQNLRRWDYFVYPHFLRTSGAIRTFYDYAQYVQGQLHNGEKARDFVAELMQREYENASDIYTRLYFDQEAGEIYIPGYITKDAFFRYPHIGHMPGVKSGKALYYMTSIAKGRSFVLIDADNAIWQYDGESIKDTLFAAREVRCPGCNRRMVLCDARRAKDYRYHCFNERCGRWLTIKEMEELSL